MALIEFDFLSSHGCTLFVSVLSCAFFAFAFVCACAFSWSLKIDLARDDTHSPLTSCVSLLDLPLCSLIANTTAFHSGFVAVSKCVVQQMQLGQKREQGGRGNFPSGFTTYACVCLPCSVCPPETLPVISVLAVAPIFCGYLLASWSYIAGWVKCQSCVWNDGKDRKDLNLFAM